MNSIVARVNDNWSPRCCFEQVFFSPQKTKKTTHSKKQLQPSQAQYCFTLIIIEINLLPMVLTDQSTRNNDDKMNNYFLLLQNASFALNNLPLLAPPIPLLIMPIYLYIYPNFLSTHMTIETTKHTLNPTTKHSTMTKPCHFSPLLLSLSHQTTLNYNDQR